MSMSKKELFRRYSLFVFSVLVNAFSIAVITKALLGTSPITSLPLVLSELSGWTLGQYTIALNFLFILLEMLFMGKKEVDQKRFELLSQVPITLCFGLFIDLSLHCMLPWLHPEGYILQFLTLLVGGFLLGVGISLEVKAGVAMVTGEYLVQVIAKRTKKEFGFVKVCFDVSLVVISCVLSLCFLHTLVGVREGTVVAALMVGPVSHLVYPWWHFLDRHLAEPEAETLPIEQTKTCPLVITIAREYGCGGHQLAEMLSKRLKIKLYDRDLIYMAAQESHLSEAYVSENEQTTPSATLRDMVLSDYEAPFEKKLGRMDALFVAQSRVIRRLASTQACIILGRLADYVLKDRPRGKLIRVFCYTDPDSALKRCMEEQNLPPEEAEKLLVETNRLRISHYEYFTGQKWGDPHNYNLMINTGSIGLEAACALIAKLYEEFVAQGA